MSVKSKAAPRRTAEPAKTAYHVEAIQRGLDILQLFCSERPSLTLIEISRLVSAVPSTTLRIVSTLEDLGFLESVPAGGSYRAGPSALRLGHAFVTGSRLRNLAQESLARLCELGGENVSLGVLVDSSVFFIDRVLTREPMTIELPIGARLPAYCTAAGKAILAASSDQLVKAVLGASQLKRMARNTVVTREEIHAQLATTRAKGYALQNEEFASGTRSIAASILGADGKAVGAVSVAVAAGRYKLAELERHLSPYIVGCAAEISARLRAAGEETLEPPVEEAQDTAPEPAAAATSDNRSRYHVEALARGLMMLRSFSGTAPRLSLTEMAQRTDSLLPTAYRVMATLNTLGYTRTGPDGRYELTAKVLELGYEGLVWFGLTDFIAPRLQKFHEETGLNIFISVLTSGAALDILSLVRPGSLSTLGRTFPLYCTPGGKCLLSYMEKKAQHALLADIELVKRTSRTVTDIRALEEELDEARARGYASSIDEYVPGVSGVGVPLINSAGECIASIACTLPSGQTLTRPEWDLVVRQARDLSEDLSGRLAARFS